MSTFFAVRDEIVEKLKEIPDFLKIYTPLNSVQISEMSQVVPSVHVNFARVVKQAEVGRGVLNKLGQQWAVTVACRNAKSQLNDGCAVSDEVGLLTEKVIQLLSGWEPDSSTSELRFVSISDGYSAAFAYVTIIFESEKFI